MGVAERTYPSGHSGVESLPALRIAPPVAHNLTPPVPHQACFHQSAPELPRSEPVASLPVPVAHQQHLQPALPMQAQVALTPPVPISAQASSMPVSTLNACGAPPVAV